MIPAHTRNLSSKNDCHCENRHEQTCTHARRPVEHFENAGPAIRSDISPRSVAGVSGSSFHIGKGGRMATLFGSALFAEDFIGSTMFFVIGGVIVAGLVGLLIFLRMKPKDDE